MKALIIGLGSMGKRRIRLLKNLMADIEIIGVDTQKERQQQVNEMGHKTFSSIKEAANENPDVAFVCTAPISHYPIIKELLENKINTFTELNLISDGYEEILQLSKDNNTLLFLSSTMLYRKEINYILKRVKEIKSPLSYIYHIGQYLPDWHPWESYKNFFVSNKRTNGCREIFGIDLPWIIEAFGEIESIHSVKNKVSNLEIDFPDRYFVTLCHKNGAKGMLAVDIVSPKAVRNLEIFSEGNHIFWEGNPTTLYDFNFETKEKEFIDTYGNFERDSRYSDNIVEDAYVDEMQNFFNVLNGTEEAKYSFEKDLYTISVMDEIEKGI